jgi:hypothetical protein
MGDKRLSDLMVIAIEKEDANKINLDKAVDRFSKIKTNIFCMEYCIIIYYNMLINKYNILILFGINCIDLIKYLVVVLYY